MKQLLRGGEAAFLLPGVLMLLSACVGSKKEQKQKKCRSSVR